MAEKEQKTFNTKLYEVCSTDKLRPVMNCIYFDSGYAYASNGNVAIKQSLEYQSVLGAEFLDGKLLHRDNYKSVMAFDFAECHDDGIACKSTSGAVAFFEYYTPLEGEKIPAYDKVIRTEFPVIPLSFIGMNPDFLIKLTKALYAPSGNIRCQFTGLDKPIKVDVIGIEDQEAILMPYILTDSLFK
jgi:hypothetical protein